MIVTGAPSSVGSGGTFLVHPFGECMIAAAVMLGEYLYPEYLICTLSLRSCKSLGLFVTHAYSSPLFTFCVLLTFSDRKSHPAAVIAGWVLIADSCVVW
jgi:hypothetical protein